MIDIKTQVHTIFMLIGPSGSGKSTFAKNVLIPKLSRPFNKEKNFKPNIQYISSDEIRQDILGMQFDKFDNIMTEASDQAFKMLFTKLDTVSSYPINAEFIVLDTTGLSDEFRNKVLDIAEKNNYNVDAIIFDYKSVDEYKKNFKSKNLKSKETSGKVIAAHMKRLRTEVLPKMKRDKYSRIHKIKNKDFIVEMYSESDDNSYLIPSDDYNIFAWDFEKYTDRILNKKYDWVSIGDVHGCIDELKLLIQKYGFKIENDTIIDTEKSENIGLIFAGDLIDKSPENKIEETIRFIHKNMSIFNDRFQLILGNHEEMVWKWITNHPDLEKTEKRIKEKEIYYNTTLLLEKNDELKNMFLDIFNKMKGWVKTIGTDKRSFIVTHAPCEVNVLEKMDGKSLKKQYKCISRSMNPDKTNDELTYYLKDEAVNNHPLHIFGHMGQSSLRTYKNKVCIDAGCVYGNKLIGYLVNKFAPSVHYVSSLNQKQAKNDYSTELFAEVKIENKNVNTNTLNETNQKRLEYIIENGISYIGGTISPADKDEETYTLESLKAGLNYYKDKVSEVILEPKYMGSRAQLYLNRDIEKSYATSRNGFKIKYDVSDAIKVEYDKHIELMNKFNLQEILLDCELMPWAAIGSGLIDTHFKVIDEAIKSEIDFLEKNGFDEAFGNLVDEWSKSGFDDIKSTINKKELNKKFGHAYNNYKLVKPELERWQTLDKHKSAFEIYHNQIEIFGNDEDEVHFKPFRLLRAIDVDNNIVDLKMTEFEKFKTFNDDDVCVFNFKLDNYEKAEAWYENITKNNKMEGCVIKPNDLKVNELVAPFLKVRNPDYLTIIYGYDMYFPKKFDKLFRQKNINKKIKASIVEYKLGEKMLETNINSDEFKQVVANMLFENEKEATIDPRL